MMKINYSKIINFKHNNLMKNNKKKKRTISIHHQQTHTNERSINNVTMSQPNEFVDLQANNGNDESMTSLSFVPNQNKLKNINNNQQQIADIKMILFW